LSAAEFEWLERLSHGTGEILIREERKITAIREYFPPRRISNIYFAGTARRKGRAG